MELDGFVSLDSILHLGSPSLHFNLLCLCQPCRLMLKILPVGRADNPVRTMLNASMGQGDVSSARARAGDSESPDLALYVICVSQPVFLIIFPLKKLIIDL